jgi:hypothetical protein
LLVAELATEETERAEPVKARGTARKSIVAQARGKDWRGVEKGTNWRGIERLARGDGPGVNKLSPHLGSR